MIALERNDDRLRATLKSAALLGSEVIVPTSALAQAWHGGHRSARLARWIKGGEIDPLDQRRAKQIGERIGSRGASDVTDAHVFCCALEYRAALVTSDPDDMEALAEPGEYVTVIAI